MNVTQLDPRAVSAETPAETPKARRHDEGARFSVPEGHDDEAPHDPVAAKTDEAPEEAPAKADDARSEDRDDDRRDDAQTAAMTPDAWALQAWMQQQPVTAAPAEKTAEVHLPTEALQRAAEGAAKTGGASLDATARPLPERDVKTDAMEGDGSDRATAPGDGSDGAMALPEGFESVGGDEAKALQSALRAKADGATETPRSAMASEAGGAARRAHLHTSATAPADGAEAPVREVFRATEAPAPVKAHEALAMPLDGARVILDGAPLGPRGDNALTPASATAPTVDAASADTLRGRLLDAQSSAMNLRAIEGAAHGELVLPELGRVSVKARTTALRSVEIEVTAAQAATAHMLQAHTSALVDEVRAADIAVASLSVTHAEGGAAMDPNGSQHTGSHERREGHGVQGRDEGRDPRATAVRTGSGARVRIVL